MIKKMTLAALGVIAMTGLASADSKPLSPGHIQEAAIMGLNPYVFSRVEIAQIEDEPTWRDRRQRIRFILENKARAGQDISHPFTSNEWLGVDGGIRGARVGVGIGY
ncbi:hypothetical protein [Paracoccus sp. (in: a-proteobacteria)]|uniref:hypothetical protein n=1 Tax=Paracoccus sp. TaxID=267 RepID=UPI0028971FC3|nr:hypothetical protein [Paracoccus sp. (in: a-proteobacteria)]